MREKGLTPYAAAKEIGITPATLYAAIRREETKRRMEACPFCSLMVSMERINRAVVMAGK